MHQSRPARFPRLGAAGVLAATLPACLSYSTGAPAFGPADPLTPLGTAPPTVRLECVGSAEVLRDELARELTETHGFSVADEDAERVDATLTVRYRLNSNDPSGMFLLSALTLFILPLPMLEETVELEVALAVPGLGSGEGFSTEGPTKHYWVGIALAPLSFIHVGVDDDVRAMSSDLARAVRQGYAERHAEEWDAVSGSTDTAAYEAFLTAFPTSVHASEVSTSLERALWKNVQDRGEVDDYLRYIEHFRDGPRGVEAVARGSDALWQEISSAPSTERIETFLAFFPSDGRVARATAMLEAHVWQLALDSDRSLARYMDYFARYPAGTHAAECADALAWANAERGATPAAVEAYLEAHPGGAYAEHARGVLEQLRGGLPGASSKIRAQVRQSLEQTTGTIPRGTEAVYTGSLTATANGMTMILEYEVIYDGSLLARYRVYEGTVSYLGAVYGVGADGEWYPRFDRLFQD